MIQKLEYETHRDGNGNVYGSIPSYAEIIAKINEVIDYINSRPEEKPSEDLNKLIQKWDRIDINTVLKVKVKATGKVIDGFYDGRGHFDHFIDHDVFDRYSIDEVELMPDEEPSKGLDVTDFCKPIDPGIAQCIADHWWEMLGENEKPSEDLEEAAEELFETIEIQEHENIFEDTFKKIFIAGAEWQKEQMMKDVEEDALLLERAWLTLDNLGYEELAERLKTFKEKYANKM